MGFGAPLEKKYKEHMAQIYSYKIRIVQVTNGTNTSSSCVAYRSDAIQHDTLKHDEHKKNNSCPLLISIQLI
jgi:hypothetical protein